MKVSYLDIFNAKPVLEKAYINSSYGKLKYATKKNLRKFEPHFEDTLEWLKADALDNDWDAEGPLPLQDENFRIRFETYLKENTAEIEPFKINESYLQHLDGITGAEEMIIEWLISEEE